MKVIYVDDNAHEAKILKAELLNLKVDSVTIFWLPFISHATKLLNARLYEFEAVICDINGTAFDFNEEITHLNHPRVIITSAIFDPVDKTHEFVLKSDLAQKIKSLLAK